MSTSHGAGTAKVRPVNDDFEAETAEARPATTAEAAPAATVAQPETRKGGRRLALPILAVALIAAAGWYGHEWWTNGRFMISTDDAYVEGDIASISPKVSGYVAVVNAVANQTVKAGDPLVTLDDGDYRLAREQAEAQIATQKLSLGRIDAQIEGARASLAQADAQKTAYQAALSGAQVAEKRAKELNAKAVGTTASLDSATVALDQAKANLVGADANIVAAKAAITVLEAQRAEAESQIRTLELARDKAERDLGFTVLKAPYDGVVGNISVQVGDLVSAGQRLAALVPVKDLYVEANFKETQIARLVPGSKVHLHVDAFEEDDIVGTVDSIAPASGSVFSLLPAENATGNFTKVTQRVPVRIAIPREVLDSGKLRAGLSVVVDVDSRTAPAGTALAARAE
ncbi:MULTISPECIES: HlyD family secretion protein [unclassified Shinella]|uniref:HlyD family secretion protein n=1 Tax=unclassified Shinella TaxID=2643062 RepID=UPI00225C8286|nr:MULTISPECIES: HlyD family secretion protein [unclassified Shinella]MCO5140773.1 HlyD family secretion protein [Shinella sp.]MDC7256538.1 HlyD family secretion protein [Shinella sp. YE25]CAI0339408.1 Membrane fusion component of tripartite multidrug resistance system [Rhizobiaceae bacterium]CAK7257812.1 membrane fusion protein, multidrug efflux system [Shinella sp. WSC3-e]